MNPNQETTINILNQKLANANLEAAQWQSLADELHKESEQVKREKEDLNKRVEELENAISERYEPIGEYTGEPAEEVQYPHEVVKAK